MEQRLDKTFQERTELQAAWEAIPTDASEEVQDKAWEDVAINAGKIRGMLEMLAIMRSTTAKVELTRSRARIKHHVQDD